MEASHEGVHPGNYPQPSISRPQVAAVALPAPAKRGEDLSEAGKPVLTASESLGRAAPFLLKVRPARPNLALTAGTRLLMSAAMEGKDASSSMISEKSPEEKPPPRRKGALAAVSLILGGNLFSERQ